jgi:hypothetical protein
MPWFTQLPDAFKDFVTAHAGNKNMRREFFTYCHREFIHEQWRVILDDDFVKAYQHGIVVVCPDGIERRFYPRIFTYSADYPEKSAPFSPTIALLTAGPPRVLMAGIRNLGGCPCPRCKVPLSEVNLVGEASDRRDRSRLARTDDHRRKLLVSTARRAILERNLAVNSAYVERLLKPESLVPTSVKRLSAPRQTRLNSAAERFLRQTWPFPEFLFDVYCRPSSRD